MSLSERSRAALYEGLTTLVDPEAAGEMLSHFPARDVDEPVTRDHLRAEMGALRAEMADLRTEMAGFKSEIRTDMAGLKSEVRVEIAGLRTEMAQGFARIEARARSDLRWMVSTLIALTAIIVTAVAAF